MTGGGGIAGAGLGVGAANARRRVGTIPGASVSTMDLPGMLRGAAVDEVEEVGGRRLRSSGSGRGNASGEGEEGLGPDDMVLG